MLNIDPDTKEDIVEQLVELCNEFRDCFAMNLNELGCTNVMQATIDDNNEPVRSKPYSASLKERQTIKEIVADWKMHGIVSETDSPYASPVLLVTKKTGEPRLVVDYRRLNQQTIKRNFPMSSPEEHLENMSGCQIFSTLDLAHGYLQVPLDEHSKAKTAFITPDETGQFERMMFGLTNAPYEFNRLMTKVLGPLRNQIVMNYLDDIICPAADWTEMMKRLRKIFEALRAANLTLKISKCVFGAREVEYLGLRVSAAGIKPGVNKTKAVRSFPKPRNVHEVRRFLGLTSYFRKFVPKYAIRARALSELTRKNVKFQWCREQEEAFDDLKNALCEDPLLRLYNPNAKETILHTDASSQGVAGILLQSQDDGELHPVYYVSKKTTDAEKVYHSSKLELMAIVYCIERLRNFLIGIKFVVYTDCQALVYLNTHKTQNPQVARWFNCLNEYDLEIRYRPGEKMAHVDALSRAAVDDVQDTISEVNVRMEIFEVMDESDYILMIQRSDVKLRQLIDVLKKEEDSRSEIERHLTREYVLNEDKLMRKVDDRELYVIPDALRKSIVVKYHDMMGHFSVDRTVAKIRELYWFPRMKRYVRCHIAACVECLLAKVPAGKQPGMLHPIPPPSRPFGRVHIDHLGPLVTTKQKNVYILVMIDALTKFVKLFPTRDTKCKTSIRMMQKFINQFGLPGRIVSDRGTSFRGEEFQKFLKEQGIRCTLNSTRWPRANGQCERVNRTLLDTLVASLREEQDWDRELPNTERNLNLMQNKTTGKSPYEALYGYIPRFHDGPLSSLVENEQGIWKPSLEVQEDIRIAMGEEQQKYKNRHDAKHCKGDSLEVGDIVVMKSTPKNTGESTKLQQRYRGPLVIVEKLPCDIYRIANVEGNRKYSTTANISQLKIYRPPMDEEMEEAKEERPKREARKPRYLEDYETD